MLSIHVGATWTADGPVGGRVLYGLRSFGDLEFSTTLQRPTDSTGGGGLLTASWTTTLPAGVSLPAVLRQGSLVEIRAGSWPIGAGFVAETPRGNTVTVDGLFRLGEKFLAVTSAGLPTSDVSVAVAQAIANGLMWRNPGTLPTGTLKTADAEATVQYSTVSALLNAYCKANGKVWWIDRFAVLRIGDLPTSPRWAVTPTTPSMETADDDYASTVFVRRVDSVGTDGQPVAWDGEKAVDATIPATLTRQVAFDLEQLGYMTALDGAAKAQAILDANKSRSAFTEGLELQRGQLITPGGVAPEPWQVLAVDPTMVRHSNWVNSSGNVQVGRRKDWVIGGTTYRQGQPLLVTPMGMAPRTQAQIVQATSGRSELVFR